MVTAVGNDNGWESWRRLTQHCEPNLVVREAQAMSMYTSMVNRKAKTAAETKVLLTELEGTGRKMAEITGSKIEDKHAISVIMGILDHETLKHTMQSQAAMKSKSSEELKRKALEFVNMMCEGTNDTKGLRRFEFETENAEYQEDGWQHQDDWDGTGEEEYGNLNGVNDMCHKCGGYGHFARECPRKGLGKGGKGKAGGKCV